MTVIVPAPPSELELVLAELDAFRERILAASVEPSATVPPTVAAGELIQASWGNAVVAALSDHETRVTTIEPGPQVWQLYVSDQIQIFGGGTICPIGSFTAPAAGWYLVHIVCYGLASASASAMNLAARVGGQNGINSAVQLGVNMGASIPLLGRFNLAAGSNAVEVVGQLTAGSHGFVQGRLAEITRVRAGN